MTSRERVKTTLKRKIPDRVPFDFSFGFTKPKLDEFEERTGQTNPDEYFKTDTKMIRLSPTKVKNDFSKYLGEVPPDTEIDEWGVGRYHTASTHKWHSHLEGFIYPMLNLSTKQDALDYPLPDIDAEYRYESVKKDIEGTHAQGRAALAMVDCTIFETAWEMRSMELLLTDFLANQDFAQTLLDRMVEKRIKQARLFTRLDPDVVCLGDDVGTQRGMMLHPDLWRQWLKPGLAAIITEIRKVKPDQIIFYHCDGQFYEIIPDLIEIGIDVLNPVQPECLDPVYLKKEYGNYLSFWGTIGTQSTFPFASPAGVKKEIKERIEIVGKGGGLFLSPSHMIEPEVPWENILAFVEAIDEFGWY